MSRVLFLLLLLAVAALYWPGLGGGFVFDDYPNIVENPALRLFDGRLASLFDASTGGIASPLGRPLSMASFAANYYYGGESPFGFKLVNLLIHLANGVLVMFLVQRLWPRLTGHHQAEPRQSEWAALWISALWLLHPINLTPVLFVTQRMTSLSTLLMLAALLLYLRGRATSGLRQGLWLSASLLLCWPAGMLAKETALLLPLYLLTIEAFALGGFRAFTPRTLRVLAGVAVALAVAALFWLWPLIIGTYQARDFTLGERLLTEMRVLWLYAGQILLPWPDQFALHHDDIPLSRSLIDPLATLWAALAWLAMLAFAFFQRRQRPWLSFAVVWFLAGHALESSVLGLELDYEHRNYLPSLGIFIGLAAALLPAKAGQTGNAPRWAAALAIVGFCALATGLRAMQWGDQYQRTQIEAMTHPESSRTHHDAGQAILSREIASGGIDNMSYQMARTHFANAARLNNNDKGSLTSMLFLDCTVRSRFDEAAWSDLLKRMGGTRLVFGEERFVHGLSKLLSNNLLCLSPEQTDALIAAGIANPTASAKIRGMLHTVAMDHALVRLGDMPLARRYAEAAVMDDPGSAVLYINLIRLLLLSGDLTAAQRQYAVLRGLSIPSANRKEVEDFGRALAH
jgi:protein O-mannosyl-transferase